MRYLAVLLVSWMLWGCGGGGGGASNGSTASASTRVVGMAAVGNGIGGRIFLSDANGQQMFVDTTDGHFSALLGALKPPLLLKAQWSDGSGLHWLYSFSNQGGTANITPLTHLLVSAASGATADSLFDAPSTAGFAAVQQALPAALTQMQDSLQPLMHQYAVAGANPITDDFAADHTGMDALLDRVSLQSNGATLTLSDKTSGAVLLSASTQPPTHAVRASTWGPSDAAQAADVAIAVNGQGLGLVLWCEPVDGQILLKARWLDGSHPAQTLDGLGNAAAPRLAFDGAGNAIALWSRNSASRSSVWASRFQVGSGQWSPALQLSSDAWANAQGPDLALDPAGDAIAVWQQGVSATGPSDGWIARFSAASASWSAATRATDGSNKAYGLRVALNANGQGLLAWQQQRGDGSSPVLQAADVWVRSLDSTSAWGVAQRLNAQAGVVAAAYLFGPIDVAVNANGVGAVLWSQRLQPTQPMQVQAALYTPGGGWGDAQLVSGAVSDDGYAARVALDGSGNALVVWQQQTAYSLYGGSNRYVAGVGWGVAGHFVDSKQGDALPPTLAMDAQGNAVVVWLRWAANAQEDLMMARFNTRSGWDLPQVVAPVSAGVGISRNVPALALNSSGQAQVVWGLAPSAVASWL